MKKYLTLIPFLKKISLHIFILFIVVATCQNVSGLTQTYYLSSGDLINCNSDCGGGMLYNCGQDVGFGWTDVLNPSYTINSVTIQFYP